jgi:hypothetical protein
MCWKTADHELKSYWQELRIYLQLGVTFAHLATTPVLKVRTIKKGSVVLLRGKDLFAQCKGHFFIDERVMESLNSVGGVAEDAMESKILSVGGEVEEETGIKVTPKGKFQQPSIEEKQPPDNFAHSKPATDLANNMAPKMASKTAFKSGSGNPDLDAVMSELKEAEKKGVCLNVHENDLAVAMKFAQKASEAFKAEEKQKQKGDNGEGSSKSSAKIDAFSVYQQHLGNGGKPLQEITLKKGKKGKKVKDDKSQNADPKENWAKWQRMGGDPRMHQAFSLEGAPYPASGATKWVGPNDLDNYDEGKDDDTIKSAVEESDTSIKMRPEMSEEEKKVALEDVQRGNEVKIRHDEAARGFSEEDDIAFIRTLVAKDGKGPSTAPSISLIASPKKKATDALPAGAPMHKKIETLRAIGSSILSPVVPPSSLNNSAYLNALGSSGVAPPPGLYNFSGTAGTTGSGFQPNSGMASSSVSGFQTQNPSDTNNLASGFQSQHPTLSSYEAMSQTSSPMPHWSNLATTPTIGFYDAMTPSIPHDAMTMGGGGSSLGYIARSTSRSGFQPHSNIGGGGGGGGGTPLRADSPAFHSTAMSMTAGARTIYPPPGFGHLQGGGQGEQQGGISAARARLGMGAARGQGQGGASTSAASGSGGGGQQTFDYNAEIGALSATAKKWFT